MGYRQFNFLQFNKIAPIFHIVPAAAAISRVPPRRAFVEWCAPFCTARAARVCVPLQLYTTAHAPAPPGCTTVAAAADACEHCTQRTHTCTPIHKRARSRAVRAFTSGTGRKSCRCYYCARANTLDSHTVCSVWSIPKTSHTHIPHHPPPKSALFAIVS